MDPEDSHREAEPRHTHAENSYRSAITNWIVKKSWPKAPSGPLDETIAILVHHSVSLGGDAFKFHSAIHLFEVTATYLQVVGAGGVLSNLKVWLVVPGYNKEILLASCPTYFLKDEKSLKVATAQGLINGHVSLLYVDKDGAQNIALKYDVYVPFARDLNDTVLLAPTNPALVLTAAELETIPVLASSELQLEQEKALAYSASAADVVQTQYHATGHEDELLAKFLHDFARDGDKLVIETYYPANDDGSGGNSSGSKQYEVSVSFFRIFDLVGSIDPETLTAAAALFVRVPIAGRVLIAHLKSSLDGNFISIEAMLARGSVALSVKKNDTGKHDLHIYLSVSLKFLRQAIVQGAKLHSLPF